MDGFSKKIPFFLTRPENLLLILGLVFGLVFALLTPPFQAPDEHDHFVTAYAVSQGQPRNADASVPAALIHLWNAVESIRFDPQTKLQPGGLDRFRSMPLAGQQVQVSLHSTRFYSSLLYLPQAAGIFLARELGLPTLAVFWAGRIFALLFWLIILHASLRIAPTFKWVLLFLMLTPVSLFLGASYSADSVTNAFSFLAAAVFLKAASPDWERIDLKRALVLAATFIPLAFLKFPYVTQIALLSLIPLRKYARRRYFYLVLLAALLCLGLWFVQVKQISGAALLGNHEGTPGNLPQQMAFILANPGLFLRVIANTLIQSLGVYFISFVGILGWVSPLLPAVVYILYFAVLLFISRTDHRADIGISRFARLMLAATSAAVVLGLITIFYLVWTPVAGAYVLGVQGRYFLPFAPQLCLGLYSRRYRVAEKWLAIVVSGAVLVILIVSCCTIWARYYA